MAAVIAEVLSALAMILLAGEYVQGKKRFFNQFLERIAIRLFPYRLFFGSRNALLIATNLLRFKTSAILFQVVLPVFIILVLTTFVSSNLRSSRHSGTAALN